MPNSAEPPEDDREPAQATALVNAVLAIEEDLSRIVEMIERMIGLVESSDGGLVTRLASAREKAEHGVALSKQLSKCAREKTNL